MNGERSYNPRVMKLTKRGFGEVDCGGTGVVGGRVRGHPDPEARA